ncbi:multidrug transporter [Pyrenochaeta sp. DS3sAY3a]|nr:multidrug transporter [Pyrenochaeta sp. DS3sAY3a]
MASAAERTPAVHDPDTVRNNEAALDAEKADSTSDNEPHHAEDPTGLATNDADKAHYEKFGTYDHYEITEEDCYDELGFSFPTWKKWTILSVIFLVQVSMNFNTSLYSNAVSGISKEFGVSAQAARVGAAVFLITYAFGCELWAPWSEELGRWPILQLSLFFVNIWQIPVAIAPNFATIVVCRALGGLSTAGGSVTLAMVADMWEADDQQYAVAFIVFSSVGGSIFGPIVGGFVEQFLAWRWNIWIQLIFGGAVQIAHAILVPETRTTVLMDRIAKKRRKEGEKNGKPVNIWGPNELKSFKERFSAREILITWVRPFRMFLTEPIVLVLSLLSGFSDAIIFMFLQSYALVYEQWDFAIFAIGLAFIPIGIGYLLAWFSFFPAIKRNERLRRERPGDEQANYEARLWWLLFTAPCLPIGLIIFAWTSTGPPIHWIGSLIGSAIIGVANYAIYMATIDYMICAYGPYSASATGGNGWARDFLAGVLTIPATPFYSNIGGRYHLAWASTILFFISLLLVVSVYVIYWKGPVLRKRSPFAQQLSSARVETGGRRVSSLPGLYGSRHNSIVGGTGPNSRRGSVVRGMPGRTGENAYHQGADAVRQRVQRGNSTNVV